MNRHGTSPVGKTKKKGGKSSAKRTRAYQRGGVENEEKGEVWEAGSEGREGGRRELGGDAQGEAEASRGEGQGGEGGKGRREGKEGRKKGGQRDENEQSKGKKWEGRGGASGGEERGAHTRRARWSSACQRTSTAARTASERVRMRRPIMSSRPEACSTSIARCTLVEYCSGAITQRVANSSHCFSVPTPAAAATCLHTCHLHSQARL